ncbi:MAG: hypothetical protein RQ966_15100 [Acetobacteraceae bacterium]|nr:hypothetical protein [Acetobacteraceae bacterium]
MANVILFAGGEDLDFATTSVSVDTTSTDFRAGYARCGLQLPPANGTSPGSIRAIGAFSSAAFWLSARMRCGSNLGDNQRDLLSLQDAGGVTRLVLQYNSGSPFAVFQKVNAAGTRTQLGSGFYLPLSPSPSTPDKIDLQVTYGVSGSLAIYVNGALAGSYAGDVTTDGATLLAGFTLGPLANAAVSWSEVIVATADTRALGLVTLAPAALGATAQWTGTAASVSELSLNDADGVSTGTAGKVEEFTTGSLPSGSFSVLGVVLAARAVTASGSPQHVDLGLKLGGTDYWSPDQAVGTAYGRVAYDWETNPATSAAFTTADLASVGLALRSVA